MKLILNSILVYICYYYKRGKYSCLVIRSISLYLYKNYILVV